MRKPRPDHGAQPETTSIITAAAAIVATGGSRPAAADLLGVKRDNLRRITNKYATEYEVQKLRARVTLETNGRVLIEPPIPYMRAGRPHRKTQDRIRRATAMLAAGATCEEVGKELNVAAKTVSEWPRRFGDLWTIEYNRAMETLLCIIRQQAGTDAVLEDPRSYLRRALRCERWSQGQNRPLFERPGAVTLRMFFRDWYRPNRLEDASPATIADYQTTIRYWMLFTSDPPLKEIGVKHLARFRDCLRGAGGRNGDTMSNNGIRRHLLNVQVLLDKALPADRGNRDGAGLLEKSPWIKKPRKEWPSPKIVTAELVGRVYQAADCMTVPAVDGVPAPLWWRTLLVFAWNTGLRKRNLLEARWDDVDWQQRRLTVPPQRHKTGRGQTLYLNQAVIDHFRIIYTQRELILPWSGGRELGPAEDSFFTRLWHRLQYAAGLELPEHFGLHTIRKTVATLLWQVAPEAAQLQLGHTTLGMTRGAYVKADTILAGAMDKLPQPAAFGT